MARTKSGHKLGRVSHVEVDEMTGRVMAFYVAAEGMIKGLLGNELAIQWHQVLEWKDDEIIVADGSVPQGATGVAYAGTPNASPAMNLSERA